MTIIVRHKVPTIQSRPDEAVTDRAIIVQLAAARMQQLDNMASLSTRLMYRQSIWVGRHCIDGAT